MMKINTDEQLQSRVINFLRFPLIIGVLFIHNQVLTVPLADASNVNTPVFDFVRILFSYILPAVSVPIFFTISGYLFFFNTDFSIKCYWAKLKKRVYSLLVPYLFWNSMYLLFYVVIAYIPTLTLMFKGSTISLEYILAAFWGCKEDMNYLYPIAYQFWFIRDLMVMIILSPLFYLFIKYSKIYGVLCVGLLWMLDLSIPYLGMRGMGSDAIFFFMLGSWLSINKKNMLAEFDKYALLACIVYPLLVVSDMCTVNCQLNVYIHNCGILLGIIVCFNIARRIVQIIPMNNFAFWSSASFFVFAIHDPWILTQIRKATSCFTYSNEDASLIFVYFTNVILTVIVAVTLFIIIKKIAPRLLAVIIGSR